MRKMLNEREFGLGALGDFIIFKSHSPGAEGGGGSEMWSDWEGTRPIGSQSL